VFGDPFDESMILRENIVEIFDLQDFNHFACARDFQDVV